MKANGEPLSLEAIDRILNAPDSAVPPEYKRHVRDQLIAIATAGAAATPQSRAQAGSNAMHTAAIPASAVTPATSPTPVEVSLPGPEQAAVQLAVPRVTDQLAQRPHAPRLLSDTSQVQTASYVAPAGPPPTTTPPAATPPTTNEVAAAAGSAPSEVTTAESARSTVETSVANRRTSSEPKRGEWRDRLNEALAAIQREREAEDISEHEKELLEASARFLHLVANHREEAVAPREELDEDEREYWKHQLLALVIALDVDDKHSGSQWAALVLRELRAAADHLSNVSALDVRNLAFCEKVESFGNYTRFNSTTFKPGKEVLLYVEIDNFTVEQIGEEYQTELQAEYMLIGPNGKRYKSQLPLVREDCRNRRHDYFIAYHLVLPEDLVTGKYTLELNVLDVKGNKSSQASIDFSVR